MNNNEKVHDLSVQEEVGRLVCDRLKRKLAADQEGTAGTDNPQEKVLIETATRSELHELTRALNFLRVDVVNELPHVGNLLDFNVDDTRVPTAARSIAACGQSGLFNYNTRLLRNAIEFLEVAERAGPVTGSSIVMNLCSAHGRSTIIQPQPGDKNGENQLWVSRLEIVLLSRLKDALTDLAKDIKTGTDIPRCKRIAWSLSESLALMWLRPDEWGTVVQQICSDIEMLRLIRSMFGVLGTFQLDNDDSATTSLLQANVMETIMNIQPTSHFSDKHVEEEVQVAGMPYSLDIVITSKK
eukprot:GDKJ01017800.1.p1 GENE.GDKJ01017800.1~~GDKJ01017800.1.p1  ORF type:complete len:350 (+),score=73.31 GDKJ01017800.1:157-1050(+)